MDRRLKQSLLPVLLLMLGACTSPITRWEDESPPPRHASAPVKMHRDGPDEYTVRSGDTLYAIAFRNQVDYHDLAEWNGIGSDYRIVPGRVLRLKPRGEGPVARAAAPAISRPKPAPERTVAKLAPAVPVPDDSTEVAAEPVSVAPSPSPTPAAPTSTGGQAASNSGFEWLWPTTGTILKTYAPQSGFKGLDFGGNFGQPVFAAAPGRVVYSGNALKGYGELIIIKHNDTYLSAYSYNRTRMVKEGDVVTGGQPIGELGMGPENKPFLHFEIRERGQPVDPMRFLPKRETTPGAKLSGN